MSLALRLRRWLTGTFSQRPLGARGEDAAVRFLKRLGYRIVERGYDSPLGELDIVAVDGRTVVFVEVKTRASTDAGHPSDAIDDNKQRRMTQSALAYLKAKRLLEYSSRFDVVAVTWPVNSRRPHIEHFKNAFAPTGSGQFFS
jgi:putative endonuclease